MAPEIEISQGAGVALFHTAVQIACRAHRDQVDKGGDPYFYHALHVGVAQLPDWKAAITGVLHDVPEDCDKEAVTEVRGLYADLPWLEHDLALLTRGPDMPYEDYIERIADSGNHRVVKVKITDLRHNLDGIRFSKALVSGNHPKLFALRERYWKSLDRLTEYNTVNTRDTIFIL